MVNHLIGFFGMFLLFLGCTSSTILTEKESLTNQITVSQEVNDILTKYGIERGAKKDVTQAIQLAVRKEGQISLPKGKYLVNGTIKLLDSQSIHLENGAWIIRKQFNEEPIIWMLGTYCSFTGNGKNSVVESTVNTPNGLIRLGHKNMQQSSRNVLHATLKDLRIQGSTYGGGNDQIVDRGVYMPNPQHKSNASYFHTVENLLIANVDIGIHLQGFANANTISNIIFQGVGNSAEDKAIWIDGAQENRISDIFHHHSTGVGATIVVTDLQINNRSFIPVFNRVEAVVSEPDAGKGISRCLIFDSKGSKNYFSISENNVNSNKLSSGFIGRKNTLQSSASGMIALNNSYNGQLYFIPHSKLKKNTLFIDKDNKLKFRDSNGIIHVLTN